MKGSTEKMLDIEWEEVLETLFLTWTLLILACLLIEVTIRHRANLRKKEKK